MEKISLKDIVQETIRNKTDDNGKAGLLVVLIDSSGSITTNDLEQASKLTVPLTKLFRKVIVLVHDTLIHNEMILDASNVDELHKFLQNEDLLTRGGTSHVLVFDRIEEWYSNPAKLDLVISFTDNCSNTEYIYKDYRWIKDKTPLLFVLTQDGRAGKYEYDNITSVKMDNLSQEEEEEEGPVTTRKKRLYTDGDELNAKGKEFNSEVVNAVQGIAEKWSKDGYSLVDQEYLMKSMIGLQYSVIRIKGM